MEKNVYFTQNTGVEKLSDLIWLYSNEFEFTKLDNNLSLLIIILHLSFRHYLLRKSKTNFTRLSN